LSSAQTVAGLLQAGFSAKKKINTKKPKQKPNQTTNNYMGRETH